TRLVSDWSSDVCSSDLLTGLGVVDIPVELGTRQQQLAGVRAHHFALLADRPFHEWRRQARHGLDAGLGLFKVRDRVMHDLAAFRSEERRVGKEGRGRWA